MIYWGNFTFVYVAIGVTVVLALGYALDFTRRRRLLEKLGHAPQLKRMAASASTARRVIKAVLVVLGVALVTLAIARPQIEGEQEWRQRGIDLAIVMDFSKSMLAADVEPGGCPELGDGVTSVTCRAGRQKLEVDGLIDEFTGDRVAIVAFAGAAVHYPLTSDYEAAKILYNGLTPLDLPPGSDIGEAILTARCILRPKLKNDPDCERAGGGGHGGDPLTEEEARYMAKLHMEVKEEGDRARAIVIFTDGEDTEGRARAEVERAAKLGIAVFVVGVGTKDGAKIPDFDAQGNRRDYKKAEDGSYRIAKLDEKALKELARTGGAEDRYFKLSPRRLGVSSLVKALRKLKEGELAWRVIKKPQEIYQGFLFAGFMLLVIEACLSDRRRVRVAKAVRRVAKGRTSGHKSQAGGQAGRDAGSQKEAA